MLTLCFSIKDELYAIPVRSVVEVVPKVLLRSLPRAPTWLIGLLAYRGTVIPVVDLCQRLIDVASQSCLSTRIVVVQRSAEQGCYGILTERVTDVRRIGDGTPATVNVASAPYLTGTVLDEGELIQLLDVDCLLPATLLATPSLEG